MWFQSNARKHSNELGRVGEQIAEHYLRKQGYRFVARNWVCQAGEIDLIFQRENIIVFVEVKTRRNSPFARDQLFSTITFKKQRKLRLLSDIYFAIHQRELKNFRERIDLIGVIVSEQDSSLLYLEHRDGAC